jgi:NTE family protein
VLKRLGEVPGFRNGPSPFAIVTGASAGAINGTMIAAGSSRFGEITRHLAGVWSRIEVREVMRTDALALSAGAFGLLRDVALGGLLGRTVTQGFLDTAPLRAFLGRVLPLAGIAEGIRNGHLYAVAISATSYHSGRSFTFVQGQPGHPIWMKSRRVVLPVQLTIDHVAASAAIPMVFPPVRVRSAAGNLYFGDGGLRLVTPFSPAIRLGATHVFGIGIRSQRAADSLSREELSAAEEAGAPGSIIPCPPLAQICGVFMNAIFLDHLDSDLDHLRRMNELIAAYHPEADPTDTIRAPSPLVSEPMRVVQPLAISPSEDLALVAQRFAHRMPRLIRYLMEGLGTPDAQSADLMSYLLFDAAYTRALVDIGYRDASAHLDEIVDFLRTAQPTAERAALAG